MKVDKLRKALEIVKPGISSHNSLIEQSTNFAFIENKVVTFNDEISISHKIKDLNITGAVESTYLYSFLKKIKVEDISIEIDNQELRIKAGKSKVGIAIDPQIKLPLDQIEASNKWQKVDEDFITALKYCIPTAGTDLNKAILTCIHVDKNKVVSADGFRLSEYVLKTEMPSFLIPAKTAKILCNYPICHIAEPEDGWIHFRTKERTIIACRILNDEYPKVNHLFEVNGVRLNLPLELKPVLERAMLFSDKAIGMNEFVYLEVKNKSILLQTKNEISWFEEEIECDYDIKDLNIEFRMNPEFLYDVISNVELEVDTTAYKLLLSTENYRHLVMLQKDRG